MSLVCAHLKIQCSEKPRTGREVYPQNGTKLLLRARWAPLQILKMSNKVGKTFVQTVTRSSARAAFMELESFKEYTGKVQS